MTSTEPSINIHNDEGFVGRILIRRFTDQLTGANDLERSTKAAQIEIDEEEETEEHRRLKQLYESPADINISPQDFEAAEIARSALQKTVDKFIKEAQSAKPSVFDRIRPSHKPVKTNATKVLQDSVQLDFNQLQELVENLEEKWKEDHGPVYNGFKKLCRTLDDHKSVFAIFPSQSIYTSVLCGSLSCLVKAAKNHEEIAETLSNSVADISDKVARCSDLVLIIKTRRLREQLANIYACMFEFYHSVIEWYLQPKSSRAKGSFNENLKAKFDKAMHSIEDHISELYREAHIGNTAMVAMLLGKVDTLESELRRQRENYAAQDTTAGRRMIILMGDSWIDSKFRKPALESSKTDRLAIESAPHSQTVIGTGITRTQARTYIPALKRFVIGDEGPGQFGAGRFWVAEEGVLPKLRSWMADDAKSRTLWVSSPGDGGGTTSARAAALAVVAAAWQAESPLISHFCQRPPHEKVRTGLSLEQVGLLGTVYSLICQLLQFRGAEGEGELDVSEASLASLTSGGMESWAASLTVLKALLDRTPVLMYCVIDGLNDLEWGGPGGEWCGQLVRVLLARQQLAGTVFHILFTTTGQSRVLPSCVQLKDRHLAVKRAREVARFGERVELGPVRPKTPVG
ncbi:hypothetical protein FQN55_008126 [Onygenales sp. PD_40]|nr:hypothetical protein FQN55_008126 [Onygenales sp. PD_40]